MSKKNRLAFTIVLTAYLLLGLSAIYLFAPSAPEPKANAELIQAFIDSLEIDSVRIQANTWQKSARYDSMKAVWQMERQAREALRKQHYDSAVHYWDSVKRVKDSLRAVRDSVYSSLKTTASHPIDIAAATEDSLRLIPGIGEVLASQIVNYRKRLGGFVNVRQVLEIEHVPEDVLTYIVLGNSVVKRLPINSSSPNTLRYHPYLSAAQVIAICNARRKYGNIEGWHELLRLPEFTEKDKERLEPYIDFSARP